MGLAVYWFDLEDGEVVGCERALLNKRRERTRKKSSVQLRQVRREVVGEGPELARSDEEPVRPDSERAS